MTLRTKGMQILVSAGLLVAALPSTTSFAEVAEIRIAKQYGLAYLPLVVMEREKLYEKHAAELGIPTKPKYITLGNNSAANDALISGSVDVITNAPPGFLIFWARTKGTKNSVRGVVPLVSQSSVLNTRNPNVKSIRDFTDKDRIVVSAIKNSGPAVLLQMAAAKEYGASKFASLDRLTVALPHPDGMSALLSGKTEITSHFTSPPYSTIESQSPGIHTVLTSEDVMGGPSTFNMLFSMDKFENDNPKAIEALVASVREAQAFINANKDRAADIFLASSKEGGLKKDDVVKLLNEPSLRYIPTPEKIMAYAEFMKSAGSLKVIPANWKEAFFKYVDTEPGN
jgi:NitT/TauT family transport system substrate-binding protein